eukprot:5706178-Pleurochrysis_carterae.AAC.1
MPSGRLNGPEKRRSTVRDDCAGSCVSGTSRGITSTRESASSEGTAAGSPGGWSSPASAGRAATGAACD